MEGRLIAVAAIFILLFAGMGALQQGYWDSAVSSESHVGFDENFTATEGATIQINNVSNKNVAYPRESEINVTQNDSVIEPGGNWTWNRHNGTLKLFSSTAFTNGADANVTGFYAVPSQQQNASKDIATAPVGTAGDAWMLLAMTVLVLAAAAVAVGRV